MKRNTLPSPHFPKTQIFVGPTESGKTCYAKKIAEGKNHVIVSGRKFYPYNPFAYQNLTSETELLIIDDVPQKRLNDLLCALMNAEIEVNRQGKWSFRMRRPHTIITCEIENFSLEYGGASFSRRFEIVQFPQTDTTP